MPEILSFDSDIVQLGAAAAETEFIVLDDSFILRSDLSALGVFGRSLR